MTACEMTNSTGHEISSDGNGGVIGNMFGNITDTQATKWLGNYIHNEGSTDPTMGTQVHTVYLENRSPTSQPPLKDPPEVGWNFLKDNYTNHAFFIYDEAYNNGRTGPIKIHDNVVLNQKGSCFGYNLGEAGDVSDITSEIYVYNNLFINCGLAPTAGQYTGAAVSLRGSHNKSPIQFCNNDIYGYGSANGITNSALSQYASFAGTLDWRNNIVVDTHNYDFFYTDASASPTTHTNNLWHYTGGNKETPPWDTTPLTSDPGFFNASINDFRLSAAIPGADLSTTVTRDILGVPRGTSHDLGAFQYTAGDMNPPAETPQGAVIFGGSKSGGISR